MGGWEFLKVDRLPEIERKPKVSISEEILNDFLKRGSKYGAYKFESRARARGVARRITLGIRKLGLENKVTYKGMQGETLYLERLDIK